MNHSKHIPYHTPDHTWTIFSGVTDFESYAEKFVVKGRFQKDVPPEVVEGYTIAEHIMAHAYYHYPAMDEALVKLLRVLEMAVKMRCKALGITLEILDNKGKTRKKVLNALINEIGRKRGSKADKRHTNLTKRCAELPDASEPAKPFGFCCLRPHPAVRHHAERAVFAGAIF